VTSPRDKLAAVVGPAAKCALLLWVLSASLAWADPAGDAKRLVAEANRLARRHPEQALAKLREAYAVYPTPSVFLPMALVEEKLGMKLDALAHYEALAATTGDVVDEAARQLARERILELELEVATIVVTVEPVGARVLVDGREVGVAPLTRPIRVAPGTHTLEITLAGYDSVDKSLDLQAGDRVEETHRLSADDLVPPPEDPRPRPVPVDPELEEAHASRKQVLIASLGFTGVFTVGAVVTGILAVAAHGRYGDPGASVGEREDARSSGRTLAITTDILIGGALIAGGFATYWYFARVRPKAVTPYVAVPANGVSVGIQGRF
jgi:PEGA domain